MHISIQEGIERVDFSAALSPDKINEIIKKLNFIDQFVLTDYDNSFAFSTAESTYRERQVRCVPKYDLKAGTAVSADMISLKLVDDQNETFNRIEDVVGRVLLQDLSKDVIIKTSYLK